MLRGTEKQIKWAEEIRKEKLAQALAWADEVGAAEGATPEQIEAIKETIIYLVSTQTDAAWWINNRGIQDMDNFIELLNNDARMGIGRDGKAEKTLF